MCSQATSTFTGWMCQIFNGDFGAQSMFDWVKLTFRALMRVETNYIENRVSAKSGGIKGWVNAKEMEIGAIATSCRFLADIRNMCYKSITMNIYTL